LRDGHFGSVLYGVRPVIVISTSDISSWWNHEPRSEFSEKIGSAQNFCGHGDSRSGSKIL
jgi:hypothetical protein